MIFKNISLLTIIAFFFNNLLVATVSKRYLTYKGVQFLLILNNFILFFFCLYFWTFFIINYGHDNVSFKLNSNTWTNISYEINLKLNSLNFLFVLLVSVIGMATNIYILNYFKYEERSEEFILLINWFIFSMIFLVISNNFFSLILGWELIGLTSFLLINFWRFKSTTLSCSFKAFTFNKISDIFLMIGFCLLWNTYKTDNIDILLTLISLNTTNNYQVLYYSGICIIISSSIKSAQLIGHLWLPDSMEAPVPASSLIHSATLVSAGIYLILKFQIIFLLSNLMSTIFLLGSFTACYGGIVAASQTDMKKLLAYSTISHCGFIFASIALNNFIVTIVYLYLHGLFKAMTFFCAGSIIKFNNTQDTRLMGFNKNQIVNIVTLIIASINLGGLPFTFGYLYKSLYLNFLVINSYTMIGYGLNICGMLCSIVYVYKIIYYSCFDYRKGFYLTTLYLLQNNENIEKTKTKIKKNFKDTIQFYKNYYYTCNFSKILAFLIIYIFSIFFFIVLKCYILKSYLFFFFENETITNDYLFLNNLLLTQSHLITIYNILFLLVIFILIQTNWREKFFIHEEIELLYTSGAIWTFFYLFNQILKKTIILTFHIITTLSQIFSL